MATGLTGIIASRQNLVTSATQNFAKENSLNNLTGLGKLLRTARNSDLLLQKSAINTNKKTALTASDIAISSSENAFIRSLKHISGYHFTEAESLVASQRDQVVKTTENVNKKPNAAQKQHTLAKQLENSKRPQLLNELQNAKQNLPGLVKQFFDTREALDQLIYTDSNNNSDFEKISQLKQNLAHYHYQLRDCERSIFNIKEALHLPLSHSDIEEKLKRDEMDTPANILNEYRQDIRLWNQEERNQLAKLDIEIKDILTSKIMQSTDHLYLPRDQTARPTKNQLLKTIEKLKQLLECHQQVVACKSHIYNMYIKERALMSHTQYTNIPSRQRADLDAAINETKKISHALEVYQSKLE